MPLWVPRSNLAWAYFGSTLAQAVVITPIQVTVMVVYLQWVNKVVYQVPVSYVVPLTLAITTLGVLYQSILTLDAYRIKNNIQICVQCIFNVCLSTSTVMQYSQIKDAIANILTGSDMYGTPFAKNDWGFWKHVSPALLICLVTSCVSSVVMCGLAYALCREFSWTLYEQITPDRRIRKRYFSYQVYLVILKFRLFFVVGFIIVYGFIDVHYDEPEFSLTMAIIPASLIHVGIAVHFVRIEARIGMVFVLLGHAAEFVYLVSRLVVLYGKSLRARTLLKSEMVFFAAVALVFSVSTFVSGLKCFTNFQKGLKPILLGQVQSERRVNDFESEYHFQRLNHNMIGTPEDVRRFALD